MHEISIAGAVLEQVLSLPEVGPRTRVTRVVVRVGALSGVDPDALAFAFEAAREGTPAACAELVVDYLPAKAQCGACGAAGDATSCQEPCAQCGSPDVSFSGGRELVIAEVGLES